MKLTGPMPVVGFEAIPLEERSGVVLSLQFNLRRNGVVETGVSSTPHLFLTKPQAAALIVALARLVEPPGPSEPQDPPPTAQRH